jgi:hypothetical protein
MKRPLLTSFQGMEDLIKQAFMQVDVLGPYVMEGYYDLIGPDGDIILPSAWEQVIQPGMAITMTMWPMDKVPSLPAQSASVGALKPPCGPISLPPRPPGLPLPPALRPPSLPEGLRTRNFATAGSSPGKKQPRRSGKDSESSMAGFLFGKPQRKRKSSSADQPSEE